MKNDLRRCDVSAVDYWCCSAVSGGRASALTSFGWRGCERGWPWGKGGGPSIRFMDGRWKGLVGLECLERLEAFPTPSSAVTGMKRGGPSLAPHGPHGPFVHLQGCSRCRAWPWVISLHSAHRLSAPPCSAMCWIVRLYGLHGLYGLYTPVASPPPQNCFLLYAFCRVHSRP